MLLLFNLNENWTLKPLFLENYQRFAVCSTIIRVERYLDFKVAAITTKWV